MAQLFCGTYFALVSVVCMNLYIALLSDTFARVYMVAQATAVMQQAKTVMMLESHLSEDLRIKFAQHLQDHCSPEEVGTLYFLLLCKCSYDFSKYYPVRKYLDRG